MPIRVDPIFGILEGGQERNRATHQTAQLALSSGQAAGGGLNALMGTGIFGGNVTPDEARAGKDGGVVESLFGPTLPTQIAEERFTKTRKEGFADRKETREDEQDRIQRMMMGLTVMDKYGIPADEMAEFLPEMFGDLAPEELDNLAKDFTTGQKKVRQQKLEDDRLALEMETKQLVARGGEQMQAEVDQANKLIDGLNVSDEAKQELRREFIRSKLTGARGATQETFSDRVRAISGAVGQVSPGDFGTLLEQWDALERATAMHGPGSAEATLALKHLGGIKSYRDREITIEEDREARLQEMSRDLVNYRGELVEIRRKANALREQAMNNSTREAAVKLWEGTMELYRKAGLNDPIRRKIAEAMGPEMQDFMNNLAEVIEMLDPLVRSTAPGTGEKGEEKTKERKAFPERR